MKHPEKYMVRMKARDSHVAHFAPHHDQQADEVGRFGARGTFSAHTDAPFAQQPDRMGILFAPHKAARKAYRAISVGYKP